MGKNRRPRVKTETVTPVNNENTDGAAVEDTKVENTESEEKADQLITIEVTPEDTKEVVDDTQVENDVVVESTEAAEEQLVAEEAVKDPVVEDTVVEVPSNDENDDVPDEGYIIKLIDEDTMKRASDVKERIERILSRLARIKDDDYKQKLFINPEHTMVYVGPYSDERDAIKARKILLAYGVIGNVEKL